MTFGKQRWRVSTGICEIVESSCLRWPDRIAVYPRPDDPVRFDALFDMVLGFAERAQDTGIGPGDLVALRLGDPMAGTVARLALLRLGATTIGLDAGTLKDDHGVAARWEITDDPAAVEKDACEGTIRVAADPTWLHPPRGKVAISGAGCLLKTTSGTTGMPKLRLATDASLAARMLRGVKWRGLPEGPVLVGYNPGASPAINLVLRCLATGAGAILPQPGADIGLAAIERLEAREAYLSPYNFNRLLALAERPGRRTRSLARVFIGGGAVSPALAERAETAFGCPVYNSYGSSETGGIAHARIADTSDLPGRVGRPYPDLGLRVVGPDGAEVKMGEEGELVARPPAGTGAFSYPDRVPIGDAGGWIATGDIVRLLPDGELQLTGRVSELLNVGGVKKAPGWFERTATGFPGLTEVAAFAVPDGAGSDVVGLAIVVADGFDLQRFAAYMHERLGPVFPLQIASVDALPVNAGGKIDRKVLSVLFSNARARVTTRA